MSLESHVVNAAQEVLSDLYSNAARVKQEYLDAQAHAATKKSELDAALLAIQSAHNRLANFSPMLGSNYQCPHCWVRNESPAPLFPVPGNGRQELLKCGECHFEVVLPY